MWTERTYEARMSPMKQTNIRYLLAHAGGRVMEGSGAVGRTLHAGDTFHGRFSGQGRTFHAEGPNHGRFRDTVTQILHMEATAGRQEGPFRSPTQSCRSVAAGGRIFRRRCREVKSCLANMRNRVWKQPQRHLHQVTSARTSSGQHIHDSG